MDRNKQTLEEKPIDQGDGLDAIWDIDEPSFDDAFGTGDNTDPILDIDNGASDDDSKDDKDDKTPNDLLDKDLDDDDKNNDDSDSDGDEDDDASDDDGKGGASFDDLLNSDDDSSLKKKKGTKSSKKEGDDSDEDDAGGDEDSEFLTFAKVLAEKELLDINEDEEIEPSIEGLIGAFGKTIENRVNEEIELFQKSLPLKGRELLKHLMDGGDVRDFQEAYSAPDYAEVNVKGEDQENNQKWIISEFMRLRGDSQEEIAETLEDWKDLGKLEKQAEKAKERLTAYNKKQKEELAKRREEEKVAKETKRKEVLSTIETTISDSSDIKGFPLGRKAKKDLLAYMTETNVKIEGPNGPQYVTQFQADEMKASQNVDDFILKAYLRMTDYNLDGVKKKSKSDLTSKFRNQLQNKKNMTGTQSKFGGNKKPGRGSKGNSDWTI